MTDIDMALSASWQGAPADRRARRRSFAAARRHSRYVRALRVLLPMAGLAIVIGFVAATHFGLPGAVDLSSASLSVTRNSIIMDHPHVTGFSGSGREYSLAASRAIQPLTNPGQVRLEDIEGKVATAGRDPTKISAEAADYDHAKSTLRLLGAIAVESADGYVLHMTGAEVDFGARTMISENPISVGYGDSEISGKRLSVSDGGKLIVIDGDVRTILIPPKRETTPTAVEGE